MCAQLHAKSVFCREHSVWPVLTGILLMSGSILTAARVPLMAAHASSSHDDTALPGDRMVNQHLTERRRKGGRTAHQRV